MLDTTDAPPHPPPDSVARLDEADAESTDGHVASDYVASEGGELDSEVADTPEPELSDQEAFEQAIKKVKAAYSYDGYQYCGDWRGA